MALAGQEHISMINISSTELVTSQDKDPTGQLHDDTDLTRRHLRFDKSS